MKFKKTLLAFCLFMCILFCVSSVAAGDVNETVTVNEDEQQTIQETNEEIDINNGERLLSTNDNVVEQISQNDNDILSYSVQVSSYSDLVNKIEQAKTTNYDNYTIYLENKKYTATKDVIEWGQSGDTSGTKTLIIEGNGATLDGDNKYSFMCVDRDYTLILNNIKIINFAKFETSGFVDKMYGGAIFVSTLGSLAVSNCEFENNYADEGGAIYCDGILVIRKSIFTKNTADSSGGAIKTHNGKCDIQTSLFESNKAWTGGAISSGVNGAIITNNIFTKNEAKKGGGAIYNGYWRETSYGTVIYDRWGNRIEGEREYFGLNTGIIKNTFAFNKAEYGAAVNNIVKSILIDSNNFYANSANSSASDVIVNNADNVEISNNVMKGTNYYSTISNSDSYSKISNNIFDNAPSTIFTIPDAGTYKTSTATDSVNGYSITNVGDTAKTYSDSKVSATFLDRNGKALANTKVTFKVGGKSFSATTNSKGVATAIIDLGVGTYDVTAVNPSTKEEKQFKLTISKADSTVVLSAIQNGKSVTLTATVTPSGATGKITFAVIPTVVYDSGIVEFLSEKRKDYQSNIVNGKATVTIPDLAIGSYSAVVIYDGDSNMMPFESDFTDFKVNKVYSIINAGDTKGTYLDSKVSATFLDGTGKELVNTKVTFKVGGKSFSATTNSKGVATAIIDLGVGTYDVTAVNPSTKEEKQFKLTISKVTGKIVPQNLNAEYASGTFTFKLVDSATNKPLTGKLFYSIGISSRSITADKNGIVTIDNSNLQIWIIENGVLSVKNNLDVGKHQIIFEGNDSNVDVQEIEFELTVSKIAPILSANSFTAVYGDSKYFIITLKESDGTPIPNQEILFSAYSGDDHYYFITDEPHKTNANGQVKLKINYLPDHYTFYVSSKNCKEISKKIVIKKITPKISAKDKTFKKSVKTKKYTITLKTNKNKAMKNTKVYIKVNGKTYTAKTNSKGVATFKITKLTKKGKFTSTITYKGNTYYNKLTKKVKITIK